MSIFDKNSEMSPSKTSTSPSPPRKVSVVKNDSYGKSNTLVHEMSRNKELNVESSMDTMQNALNAINNINNLEP